MQKKTLCRISFAMQYSFLVHRRPLFRFFLSCSWFYSYFLLFFFFFSLQSILSITNMQPCLSEVSHRDPWPFRVLFDHHLLVFLSCFLASFLPFFLSFFPCAPQDLMWATTSTSSPAPRTWITTCTPTTRSNKLGSVFI